MRIRVGLENGIEGYSLAWALDYPGCFCSGADSAEALLRVPQALLDYCDWTERNNGAPFYPPLGDFDIRMVEAWNVYSIDRDFEIVTRGGYEVNAWFRDDWRPVTAEEIERAIQLLAWSRADLLASVRGLTDAKLNEMRTGERWSINGILKHVAGAEWWYLNRLGLEGMERSSLAEDPLARLEQVRKRLLEALPALAGSNQVVGKEGEFWSPRKLIRRALWHELDHRNHIRKLLLLSSLYG